MSEISTVQKPTAFPQSVLDTAISLDKIRGPDCAKAFLSKVRAQMYARDLRTQQEGLFLDPKFLNNPNAFREAFDRIEKQRYLHDKTIVNTEQLFFQACSPRLES